MIDIAAIGGIVSSLQTASEIAKGIVGLRDTSMIQSKVIELQSLILAAQTSALSAQAEQSSLLNRIGALEKENAKVKAWEAEKQKYELKELKPGNFAYYTKDAVRGAEPAHHICANCYSKSLKSILQKEMRFPGKCEVLACHSCGSLIYLTGNWHLDHGPK